jgi:hypothetical protein
MSWESIAASLMPSPYEDKAAFDALPDLKETPTKDEQKPKPETPTQSVGVKTYLFVGLAFATITITVILIKKYGRS